MTDDVIFVCPHCGSSNVLWDAYAEWDTATQDFSLRSSFDYAVCDDCGYDGLNPFALALSHIPETLPLRLMALQQSNGPLHKHLTYLHKQGLLP